MGLFNKIANAFGTKKGFTEKSRKLKNAMRKCHFEVMEPRQVLSADPVLAGITYLEGDLGQDTTPDYFEVTFEGGSATTQMTQFVINGDQDLSGGLSDGDMFFDVDGNQPGTGGNQNFQFDAANSSGITASDVLGFTVGEDGLSLTVDVQNFEAGDVLAFTIDVDEVERLRVDKIASGVEFESTIFDATFVDQHYNFQDLNVGAVQTFDDGFVQQQTEGYFYDYYDNLLQEAGSLAGSELQLDLNNETGQADRTAAAIDAYELIPKPITISGTVYHDENINCELDADESGIGGVNIDLQKLNDSGVYETVASTQTDPNGDYEFGLDLNLMPGTYRLVEHQPDGFLDVGASAGYVEGVKTGEVHNDLLDNPNIISNIEVPLGGNTATDYDFKEVRPATLSGNVYHDRNDNGLMESGEEGIANVLIRVTRVGAKDPGIVDVFADAEPIFVRTDSNGHYEVDSLPPGIYEVVEINSYPANANPLATYIDGKDTVGNILGTTVGSKTNDKMSQIELCADDDGVEYNFGELRPAQISGYVSLTTPEGDCLDPTDPHHIGIEGVEIQLLDQNGELVATTLTDDDGRYEFDELRPGVYTIVEIQPAGYNDANEHRGTVDGVQSLGLDFNDRFNGIVLNSDSVGQNFNFCETLPAELCGIVWHDSNDDGVLDANEDRIGGVVIQLFDENGSLIAEERTNAEGEYCFTDLAPGTYSVMELQPTTFTDGKDSVGTIVSADGVRTTDGGSQNDKFTSILLNGGDRGVNFNFGEIKLAEISGRVHADANGDCEYDPAEGDYLLEGVEVVLYDGNGNEVARTLTDANGEYAFTGLRPGEYSVVEIGPDNLIDGEEILGTVDGVAVGTFIDDQFNQIFLSSGSEAVNYDFCEHIPAELCGTVYHDRNNNGTQDAGEEGIGNTLIELFDENGNLIASTITDSNGDYCFTELKAGKYTLTETQPTGFIDGKDSLGSVPNGENGQISNDEFVNICLLGGEEGTEYNFGELKLAEISGYVHLDPNNNCLFERSAGDRPLEGVTLELLNSNGEVIDTTTTDSDGYYEFTKMLPGEYSVRQIQPDGLFTAGQSINGVAALETDNLLEGITIRSGQKLTQHNFCENEPAEIHGRVWEDGPAFQTSDGQVPDNYRQLRDGIYDASVDQPIPGVRMTLYYFIDPTLGVDGEIAPRPVKLSEVMSEFYPNLSDPDGRVTVLTDANGEYWFKGLQPGNYIVLEDQPENYVDSNDTPGSTQGFTYNSASETQTANAAILQTFSVAQVMDSVIGIQLSSGGVSVQNNFSEVRAVDRPDDPWFPPPEPPTPQLPEPPRPGLTSLPGLYGSQAAAVSQLSVTVRGVGFQMLAPAPEYSWHLSVVNAGQPRAESEALLAANSDVWQLASHINSNDWNRFNLEQANWLFANETDGQIEVAKEGIVFGTLGGIPLAGDFDGDGTDEVAVYKDGYWFIDINGDGRWDDQDLLAKLGDAEDRPVIGDWDGDGKDDIGIYGPMWAHDPEAISEEPGLPNPENHPFTRPKNLPPVDTDATNGARTMKLTSFGKERADIVDHVFGTGDRDDVPVTGDWNGNGIRSIGHFRDGIWQLDINGDGEFDHNDETARFGQAGDVPLVGDFDGDGVEEIAVYRSGTWIIDSNGNREIDATDKTFELGQGSDQPVVGDFDGDGTDDPALYRTGNWN